MNITDTNILAKSPPKRGQVKERILRVILSHTNEKLTKYRIMKLAKANISWVIEFLRVLQSKGLVEGTSIKDYKGLIVYWKKMRIKPESREYLIQQPLEVLENANLQYALTTYYAENLVQKYLFTSRIDVYISKNDFEIWHKLLSKSGLVGKGNVRVLVDDEHVFYKSSERAGLKIVSMPQLIVDLLVEGGPCEEAANMLIQKEIDNVSKP